MWIYRASSTLAGLLLLIAFATAAEASDFYAKAELGTAYGTGTPSGPFNLIGGPTERHIGTDTDSSGLYGLAAGIEIPTPEVTPWKIGARGWTTRLETELVLGTSFDHRTNATNILEPFFHKTDAPVTWLNNVWFDVPVYRPMSRLFKPVSWLKPVSLYTGAGIGMSYLDVKTLGPGLSTGEASNVSFAWQVAVGFSYEVTSRVSLSAGYRYLDFGAAKVRMTGNGVDPNLPNTFELGVASNGFDAGVRVKFYSVDFPKSLWDRALE